MLKDLVFFTLNDFSQDDGGTVRIYGILNSIAKSGKKLKKEITDLPKITVQNIRNKILYYNLVGRDIVFFEYIDNSIGYILKKLHVIDDYINDIHGVASIEFKYKENK